MRFPRTKVARSFVFVTLAIVARGPAQQKQSQNRPTPEEAHQISEEAYIYGFAIVSSYQSMYKQAIDTTNSDRFGELSRRGDT